MPRTQGSISLFVPFYDELLALPEATRQILAVFDGLDLRTELLLVDDGSRDGSGELADHIAAGDDRIVVVHHERNLGYGAALVTGFSNCTGDVVMYSDADLPVRIGRFVEALPLLEDADLVVGYPLGWDKTLRRRLYTGAYTALARRLLGLEVRDINFSFKLIRRELLERIRLDARTGFVDAQILVESVRAGAKLVECGVDYQERQVGETHFDDPMRGVETGLELLRWWWADRRRR